MSKQLLNNELPVLLQPDDQIKFFAEHYRPHVNPASYTHLVARTRELNLEFTSDELVILAALDTPGQVQAFLNTRVYYNNDHSSVEQEETAMPPRGVLRTAHAHCFEGALFAYAVNYLHGHNPCWVLLEASQDPDHNLVVFQDPRTGLYGSNAHSHWPHLDGRSADYPTIWSMVETYIPWYISDLTNDPIDLTLVGYSDPFDLISKFGTAWIATEKPIWDIYYTFIDQAVRFHYLYDTSSETHLYPVVRALKEKWIQVNGAGQPFVSIGDLPPAAQELWHEFWRVFTARPTRGRAREIEQQFARLTGTTPIDLSDNADDFQYYLAAGFRIEDLLVPGSKNRIANLSGD
jgi:hypothetical protein